MASAPTRHRPGRYAPPDLPETPASAHPAPAPAGAEFRPAPPAVRFALAFALAALVWLGLVQLTPPPVAPAGASATQFSGERAMRDLAVVAAAPRPAGTPAHAAVRWYLAEELTRLGLQVEVQTTTAVNRFPGSTAVLAGTVHNVVARLPGTAPTGAIALDAHYDGAANGPGAADCGAGVVTLLETARALTAGPPLRNDVLFVFADAEEDGDLGAAAFNAEHPWAGDVRVALALEGYGSGGPSTIYATGAENRWLVGEFLRSAPRPVVSSFPTGVLGLEPGSGMDLDDYTGRGAAGLGFTNVGFDVAAYHTARDSVADIDPRSVQHDGDNVLALTRRLGGLDLTAPPRTGDAVFFNLLPGVVPSYRAAWAPRLAAAVGLLYAGLCALGFRRRSLTPGRFLLAAVLFPVGAVAAVVAATLLWWAVKSLNPVYQIELIGTYQLALYLVALAAVVVALTTALDAALRGRVGVADLAAGAGATWLALMLLTAVSLPAASFLFTWPLLASLLASGWAVMGGSAHRRPWLATAVLTVAAAPGVLLAVQAVSLPLAPLLARFEAMTGLPLAALPTFFVALLVGLLAPQLAVLAGAPGPPGAGAPAGRQRWLMPLGAAVVGSGLIVWANATAGFDAAHPRTSSVAYRLDVDAGAAAWLSFDRAPDAWAAGFVPAAPGRQPSGALFGKPAFAAPAPAVALPAPELRVLADTTGPDGRTLRLRLASPRGASRLMVQLESGGDLRIAEVDGRAPPANGPTGRRVRAQLAYAVLPAEGVVVVVVAEPGQSVTAVVEDASDGLPAIPGLAIPPRPAGTMPAPGAQSLDPTVVAKRYRL
jgi:hypothetical protein